MFGKSSLRIPLTSLATIISVLAGLVPTRPAWAADGLPGTPQFGYGGRLDIQGQGIPQAIDLAAGMNFTWMLVEFDWALYWPDPTIPPILDPLDSVAAIANEKNINLVISLFNPPVWAITAQGPSPESTSQLVIHLATRYPGTALAFELFPGANTYAGWSASPSPKRYTD